MANHNRSVKRLAAEDYQLIEAEHARLHELLDNLRATCLNLDNELNCGSCDSEKQAACLGQLTSSFHNLIYITDSHFAHEEDIMRKWPYIGEQSGQFDRHRQAHAGIMTALRKTVDDCSILSQQGATAESYRLLYRRMSKLLEEHARLFDDPFIHSTMA